MRAKPTIQLLSFAKGGDKVMRRSLAALAFVAAISPGVALAQSAADKAQAQTLFDDGRHLMDQGKFAEACRKLEGSQKLDPGAGTLLNLAACYEKNGQLASAWVTYKDAAVASGDRHRDWAKRANDKATELAPSVPKLTIAVTGQMPGLVVTRDGETVSPSAFSTELPIDAGPHTIEARAPGHKSFAETVDVAKGGNKTVNVPALDADAIPIDVARPQQVTAFDAPAHENKTQLVVGATVVGVGVIGLGVGAVFGFVALGKKSDAAANCTADYSRCNAMGVRQVDDAKSAGTISTVALVLGGVLVAGGLVVALTAPKSESAVHASIGAPGAPAGVSLGGSF